MQVVGHAFAQGLPKGQGIGGEARSEFHVRQSAQHTRLSRHAAVGFAQQRQCLHVAVQAHQRHTAQIPCFAQFGLVFENVPEVGNRIGKEITCREQAGQLKSQIDRFGGQSAGMLHGLDGLKAMATRIGQQRMSAVDGSRLGETGEQLAKQGLSLIPCTLRVQVCQLFQAIVEGMLQISLPVLKSLAALRVSLSGLAGMQAPGAMTRRRG